MASSGYGSADRINVTAPATVSQNTPFVLANGGGGLVLFPEQAAASGALVSCVVRGEFDHAKAAEAITAGDPAFWDDSAGVFTKTSASGVYPCGTFTADALLGDATARVHLEGIRSTPVA